MTGDSGGRSMRRVTIIVLALAVLVSGCSQYNKKDLARVAPEMQAPIYPMAQSTISSGDAMYVQFLYQPELNTRAVVDLDGTVFLPLMGNLKVAGRTPQDVHAQMMAFYKKELRSPDIVISIERPDSMIFVAGEIRSGGPMPFRTNMTVAQILAAAAPDMVNGDVSQTVLVRKDVNDPERYISYLVNADFSTGNARNIYVSPGDIVVVPRKGIVLAGDFVRQYIEDLIPAQLGVNYGFVHEVHSEPQRIEQGTTYIP